MSVWKVKRLRKARQLLKTRCKATANGYRCDFRYHHRGEHVAVTSVTTTNFLGRTYESERKSIRWPNVRG